ncbi:RelA/SpoT domain-containing protein [Acinetobacter haemolyticus]|uniref:RelA/SpoT domain-containing protein n=1 Tax=Acinetobacter haemolyticus TaxID=29430 RepID=UPI00325A7A84
MELEKDDLDFLQIMDVDIQDFQKTGLLVKNLKEIAADYKQNELILLDEAEYIAKKLQRCTAVHSVRWRIKSIAHLIKKIVRKLSDKIPSEKYREINVNNYKTIVTDLIGVRAIYLFKSDWESVHKHILSRWVLKENEPVKIYHRKGDNMNIYNAYSECEQEIHFYNYRSIHYLVPATKINTEQVYCEIQTRTIFEEGWSEIDHKVRYPDFSEDENLMSYLTIFNRLAGSADEMGSYVNDLVALIKLNNELEHERQIKEKQFVQEKEKLDLQITQLSRNGKNVEQVKAIYEQLVSVQKEEIESLKSELKSQMSENLRLNRKEPMVKYLNQRCNLEENGSRVGTIEIEVTRTNKFATFTGHFDPVFDTIPDVEGEIVKVEGINTDLSELSFKIGVGKSTDFNVHLFNNKIGYVEVGKYTFKYKAYVI